MTPSHLSVRTRTRAAVLTSTAVVALALPAVGAATASASVSSPAQVLRQQLVQAPPGSTVRLPAGLTAGVVLKDLRVRPGVVLQGTAAPVARVTVVRVSGGLSLSQFTVTGPLTVARSADVTVTRSRLQGGVMVRDGSLRTTVSGSTVSGGRVGIASYSRPGTAPQRGLRIEGNDISGQTGDNIQLGPSEDVVVRGNRIRDLRVNSAHNDGVQAMDVRGLLITGNRFTNQDQAVLLKPEPGIFPGARITGAVVRDNLVVRSRGAGFILVDTTSAQVQGNSFADNVHADVHLEGRNTGLVLRHNVGKRLFVTRGALAASAQSENCFRYGRLTATDRRSLPRFQDQRRFLIAATSPCRAADRTPWGWSAPIA